MVALSVELAKAPRTMSARASRRRESAGSKSGTRRRRNAPVTAASVAPAAWPAAVSANTGLWKATTKQLAAIAGQTREPQASTAASAIPDAGQTGPRLPLLMLVVA